MNHARSLGLDMAGFQKCFKSGRYAREIREDLVAGQRAGVRGTPTFFEGTRDAGGSKLKAVRMIRGAQSYNVFKVVLDSLLASKG